MAEQEKKEKEESRKFTLTLVVVCTVLLVVGVFAFLMLRRESSGVLRIKTLDSELEMTFADSSLDFSELLRRLLEGENRSNTLAILRDTYGVYEFGSDLLVDRIRREPGDSPFSQEVRQLLYDLKGPFARPYHSWYDISVPGVVDALNDLGYDHQVARELRRMADDAEGIFEPRSIEVEVTVSPPDWVRDGYAEVCEGSWLRGRNLLLLNSRDLGSAIRVSAGTCVPCLNINAGEEARSRIIRINTNDGRKLFGPEAEQSYTGSALMYPVKKGLTVDPILLGSDGTTAPPSSAEPPEPVPASPAGGHPADADPHWPPGTP